MNVLPYLAIRDEDAGCDREILNNCRTLAYMMRRVPHGSIESGRLYPTGWEPNHEGCGDECCCPSFDDGNYTYPSNCHGNPAPWFDSAIPATAEAFGMLVDEIELESTDSARVVSEQTNPYVTITGRILASSRRGLAAYKRWLKKELSACCSACGGLHLSFYEHCAKLAEQCAPNAEHYSPPLDTNSEDPEPVKSPTPAPWSDDGNRTMLRARFRSINDLTDDEPLPDCVSCKVVIQLEMGAPEQFARPIFCCSIDTWMSCEPGPRPLDIGDAVPGCEQCGVPCRCVTEPEIVEEDGSLPDVDGVVLEPANDTPLEPKPLIEPSPPDCPPEYVCANENSFNVDPFTGYILDIPEGFYTFGTQAGIPNTINWQDPDANRWWNYLQCLGAAPDLEAMHEAWPYETTTNPQRAVMSIVAGGATFVSFQFFDTIGGTTTWFYWCSDDANDWTWATATIPGTGPTAVNPPCEDVSEVSGDNPIADLECITGCTPVSPTLDGEELPAGVLYPFPLVYNGTVVNDGDEFAALLTAERGCGTIVWNDEFHPETPCTYCLPNDCPREVVADLTTPADRVSPLVDGVQGICPIPWPLTYKGQTVNDGDEFAALLAEERDCDVSWDDAACVYVLPKECPRTTVAELSSVAGEVTDEECYQVPDQVRRGACYIPAMPEGLTTAIEIEFCNTTEAIENATIAIYPALAGAPHILHQTLGGPRYHATQPIFEGQISGLAPFSNLLLDGRDGNLSLECLDGSTQAANGVIQAPGRKPARIPTLGCGPHWVEIRLDCDNAGDLDQTATIRLHPVMDPA